MKIIFKPIEKSNDVVTEKNDKSFTYNFTPINKPEIEWTGFEASTTGKDIIVKEPKQSFPERVIEFFTQKPDRIERRGIDNLKELWNTPLGLSEKQVEESRRIFGDTNTLLGKINSVIIEGGIRYGDLGIRTVASPIVFGTGLAGDMMQTFESIFDATDFSPKTAGDKFNDELLGILTMGMGLTRGTFRPTTANIKGTKIEV